MIPPVKSIDNAKAKNLGLKGEDVLLDFFANEQVVKSDDRYDMIKDLIVNGTDVEVKTQVPYRFFGTSKSPAFTIAVGDNYKINSNQLNKCMNVHQTS